MQHPPMTYQQYLKLPGLRWSHLKHMRRSALQFHYSEQEGEGDRESPAMVIGRCVHCGVLERERIDQDFIGWSGERRGKAWTEFAAKHPDQTILNAKEWECSLGTIKAILECPDAVEYLSMGRSELVVTWTDETRIECKSRNDLVNGHLIELKTTHDPLPRPFASLAANLGYIEQLAHYRAGLRANGIEVESEAIIIAAESKPPHDVVVFIVTEETLDLAEMVVRGLLRQVASCRKTNRWPGVAPKPRVLQMPKWWLADDDEPLTLNGEAFEP